MPSSSGLTEKRVVSGFFARMLGGRASKNYRIACLYEDNPDLRRPFWRSWPSLFDAVDGLFRTLPGPVHLRSSQYDPEVTRRRDSGGTVVRFRKLAWSEKNNRKWVDDLVARPELQLGSTEFWSPWVNDLEDRRGGPDLYMKVDGADSSADDPEAQKYDWQSLTLALRHDRLAASAVASDRLLGRARALMPGARLIVFDRGWAEHGNYTSFVRVNGLEDSYPAMLQAWLDGHSDSAVASFGARRR